MIYHAYEVYTNGAVDLGADTDPAKLLLRLADDLKAADGDGGMERLIIGQVEANSVEDALNAVRAGEWLEAGFADCQGVSAEPEPA